MRTKDGAFRTLEQDIFEAFDLHGLIVQKEEVNGNKWIITAVRKDRKK